MSCWASPEMPGYSSSTPTTSACTPQSTPQSSVRSRRHALATETLPGAATTRAAPRPRISFGIHLTLVCDIPSIRWGPLAAREEVSSLLSETGELFTPAQLPGLLVQARLDEVELEFRAQVNAVADAGLTPTHLDWHCLADGGRDDIFDLTVALARVRPGGAGLARARTPQAAATEPNGHRSRVPGQLPPGYRRQVRPLRQAAARPACRLERVGGTPGPWWQAVTDDRSWLARTPNGLRVPDIAAGERGPPRRAHRRY